MRCVRFADEKREAWGILTLDEMIQPLTAAPYLGGVAAGQMIRLADVRLLAPCQPSKIVAVGKNYRDHISELGGELPVTPILFIKPSTCVNDPDGTINLPPSELTQRVDYEGELALVISRRASHVSAAAARDYILGFTCLNDVTARDIQEQDGQWTRAKSFDGFAPIGPWLTDEVDPANLAIQTTLNGKIVQESSTGMQIWPVDQLVAFVSQAMTLLPGDVITTGTPSGIGAMKSGDEVAVSIEGIGCLRNTVR